MRSIRTQYIFVLRPFLFEESLEKLPFFFYYFTMIVSTVFTASANSSSIFSLKFSSDLRTVFVWKNGSLIGSDLL